MAAGEIVVPLGDEHLAGHDHLLLDVVMSLVGFLGHFPCPQYLVSAARRMMMRGALHRNRTAA
jgi:hypothetical protein